MNNSPINSTINSTSVVELADASSLNVISKLTISIFKQKSDAKNNNNKK